LEAIPEIEIIGKPCMNILAYATKKNLPDIYVVADFMEQKGWVVDRQQLPPSVHLTVFPYNIPVIGQYVADLKAAINWAKANPAASGEGNAAMYGLMARIPLRGMVKDNVRRVFLDTYGKGLGSESPIAEQEKKSPKWMGRLNRVLAWWTR
jgi:sphinganine-1-phosphate aldolase